MSDTLGRKIKRESADTASAENVFEPLNPLSSATFQVALTSDVNLLGEENAYRMIASVPGFIDISRPSPTGVFGGVLSFSDFDFLGSLATPYSGGALVSSACLGTHAVHRGTSTLWPRAVLRGRVELPSSPTESLGYILVASPGRAGVPTVNGFNAGLLPGGSGVWEDLEIVLPLSEEHLAPLIESPSLGSGGASGIGAIGETVAIMATTFWVSFFSTAGKCQAVALMLSLEPTP